MTIGKVYEIHAVNGYGDVSDFIFTDDLGNENRLGSFFLKMQKARINKWDLWTILHQIAR